MLAEFIIIVNDISICLQNKIKTMLHKEKEDGNLTNRYKRPKNSKSNVLSEYKITNKMIAKWFKYSNDRAFNSSTAKDRILKGIEEVVRHIENVKPYI